MAAAPTPIWQMDRKAVRAARHGTACGQVRGTKRRNILRPPSWKRPENATWEDNLPGLPFTARRMHQGQFLEELDNYNIEVIYKRLAVNSVAYMLMARCGLDTGDIFLKRRIFSDITNFQHAATLNAIGIATSDISGDGVAGKSLRLSEVLQIEEKRQNHTFGKGTP